MSRIMSRTLIAAALALTAIAGAAHAASHNRDTFIREQDLDGDGKVSKDEYAAGRDREFARQDADGDGGLSHVEYVNDFKSRLDAIVAREPAERREEQRVRELRQADVRFGVLDSDKSGKITKAEFAYTGWNMFVHHDTNEDGAVSKDDPVKKADAS